MNPPPPNPCYPLNMQNIKKQKIWVLWKKQKRDGKDTKVPYQVNKKLASTTDSNTWETYDNCKKILPNPTPSKGMGIIFEKSAGILGVDFDHCVEDGVIINPIIEKFVAQANTYTEYSPSKTGLHLLFQSEEQIELERNKHHFDDKVSSVEIYSWGRYFTFTEDTLPGKEELRLVNNEQFTDLIKELGYPWKKKKVNTNTITIKESSFKNNEELIEKMFSSSNGSKIKELYDGDLSGHNNDASSADFALCMHLAFWTQRNGKLMEEIWLQSPLGQRQKTTERADYRERTIQNAIDACSEVYTPTPKYSKEDDGIDYDFELSGGKTPVPQLAYPNIIKVLRLNPMFEGKFRKNEFSHFVESNYGINEWTTLNDDIISQTREFIATNFPFFFKLSKDMTTDAVMRVANDNVINPPRDYLTTLVWDKTPRLNSWIHHVYGTPDDELHQAIGANWMKGLVKRVMRPGCQFDEVLALESPQGWRKSTSIRVLGEPWHAETTHDIDNKDFYLLLAQNIIVEFSEGDIFNRSSMNKVKAEITKVEDQVRPPYERGIMKFKRSCVFAVTTNKLELKDDTGNRRWLPVQLEKIANIDWIREHRDQLYAEAYHRVVVLGETTYEYPKEALEDLQTSRTETNSYDETLLFWYAGLSKEKQDEGISLQDATRTALGAEARSNTLDEIKVGSSLRRTLYLDKKNKRVNGAVVKRWFPTEKTWKTIIDIKTDNYDEF